MTEIQTDSAQVKGEILKESAVDFCEAGPNVKMKCSIQKYPDYCLLLSKFLYFPKKKKKTATLCNFVPFRDGHMKSSCGGSGVWFWQRFLRLMTFPDTFLGLEPVQRLP